MINKVSSNVQSTASVAQFTIKLNAHFSLLLPISIESEHNPISRNSCELVDERFFFELNWRSMEQDIILEAHQVQNR